MDDNDPITQFFPDQESVDLYAVLSLKETATTDDIKKAYRRLALLYHPDKHASSSPQARAEAATKFQQVGFAYAVFSDEKRRQRYDRTGKTDEGFELAAGEDGWEAYFEDLFERVTRGKLDEMKKDYQRSQEEVEDLKDAYMETGGSIGEILNHIPHSTNDDEPRFIVLITDLIAKGDLPSLPTWESSIKDEKSRLVRKKQSQKEAQEAEELAKELGVWDEFYGSGKATEKKAKGKGKQTNTEEEDYSALQALMLKRKKQNMDGFFDNLAAKYTDPGGKGKSKSGGTDLPKKKSRKDASPPPEMDDGEFENLQKKLFGDKSKANAGEVKSSRTKKGGKGRKVN